MTEAKRTGVFISYSHDDSKWLKLLQQQLAPYKTLGTVSYWDDTQLKPGDEWFPEIKKALASAKVAVLLVTPAFLNSDFIRRVELPDIFEAAQKEGLRVFWLLVKSCPYEQTWLAQYEAAHKDLKNPFEKMRGWKRNDVLRTVCKKIEEAVSDTEKVEEAVARPNLIARARVVTQDPLSSGLIRCDRENYLKRFGRRFREGLQNHPELPHVYLIFGRLGQAHDTVVERVYSEIVKPLADREQGTRRGVLHKESDLDWPEPDDDLDFQQEAIQIELSKQYAYEDPEESPFTLTSPALAELKQLSNWRFVTVKQTINLTEWPGAGAKQTSSARDLLEWYLKTYWAELARTYPQPPGAKPRPQFLVFIKVTYRVPGALKSFLSLKSTQLDKERVSEELAALADEANQIYPCYFPDELETPLCEEVVNWYKKHKVFRYEQDCLEAAERLYEEHGDNLTMSIIEKALDESLTQSERSRRVA